MPTGTRSKVRDIIKAKELINLLQDNVLDEKADPLHQSKLHAIKILLAKSLPDLKAMEIKGVLGHTDLTSKTDDELKAILNEP